LQFDELKREETIRHNLRTLYGIAAAPCDTQLRSILDPIDPVNIEPAFIALHQAAEKVGLFKQYEYLDGRVLISIDGTGQFSSGDVACHHCCTKKHRSGAEEYYHQLLGAVVVHPDYRAVIPLAPEPITKSDGQTKNDCERNAAKRLLKRIHEHYKHLKPIIIEDGLSSNGPHVKKPGLPFRTHTGHGRQYLASVFGYLTFLAFLIDQLQAWGCCLFQQARQARHTLKSLWDKMRALFTTYLIATWDVFWRAI
jgi:hypothetical protein